MSAKDYTATVERALLASCLLQERGFARTTTLVPDDFADPRHQVLFATALELAASGRDVHPGDLALELVRLDRLALAGGLPYVIGLVGEQCGNPRRLPEYVGQLAELSARRRAVAGLAAQQANLADPARPLAPTLDALRETIAAAARSRTDDEFAPLGDMAEALLAELRSPTVDPGLPTGIGPLDEALGGGLQPTQLVVVAGATGMGKTALGTQIALGAAAVAAQHPDRFGATLYFSYEMSQHELYLRMVAQVADVRDGYHPPRGWSGRDLPLAEAAVRAIAALPLVVRDDLAPTAEAIRASVERYALTHGTPGLVVVDHLHLLSAPRITNQVEALGHISTSLKSLAMAFKLPILALAQLNREAVRRDDHRPLLADLRASGAIEQNANVVLFVHRPSYYLDSETRREQEAAGAPAELIVAKNRSGPTATIAATWLGPRTLFVVDPAWQPRYGPSPTAVPSLITPPARPPSLEERLIAIVADHLARTGQRATRAAFFGEFGVARKKWQDWGFGRVVDRLVDEGRLCAEQVGSGTSATYRYWLPGPTAPGHERPPELHGVADGENAPAPGPGVDDGELDELFG